MKIMTWARRAFAALSIAACAGAGAAQPAAATDVPIFRCQNDNVAPQISPLRKSAIVREIPASLATLPTDMSPPTR